MKNLLGIASARLASRRAKKTQDVRDWLLAADAWGRVVRTVRRSSRIWLQYAHALRRSGQSVEAGDAYRRVLALKPGTAAAWTGLGIAFKAQGQRSAAIDAFVQALRIDPLSRSAREELLRYGARGAVPEAAHGRAAIADALAGLRLSLDQANIWRDEVEQAGIFPALDYDAFRKQSIIGPPPGEGAGLDCLSIRIDARGAAPARLRATLRSLIVQSRWNWRAEVLSSSDLRESPIGSMAHVEPRIHFIDAAWADESGYILHLEAGTVLNPHALAWFGWTAGETGCSLAYCDHDHMAQDWKYGASYSAPVLQPVYDPYWFDDALVCPAAFLTFGDVPGGGDRRTVLRSAAARGTVAHIPRILASNMGGSVSFVASAMPEGLGAAARSIAVVIPTRDNPALLERCVASLLAKADNPQQIEILIVSNRSAHAETHALLGQLAKRPLTRILNFDEPFNWSRANNVAAQETNAEILLFLNDDTEMLSSHWDSLLIATWENDDKVGAVGARLLYPSGGVQHAGIILGLDGDGPQHEARWQNADECGPHGRWLRLRTTSAVTGAFLAMPRQLFVQVGGFNELDFAIAYNDIDMCLRLRELGRVILYDPRLILTHYESVSRGANLTSQMLEWDQSELHTLYMGWGDACLRDPGYNPHFATGGYPFDGYRDPPLEEILRHVRHSASPEPWRVARRS
ncbi:hypothetical protein SBA_ch1_36240 [Sphingomonas bisphenolicum]|uniref:Glycosyltransferase 2-like domain-containing protein n=1 Tax=Sphingomonas bisphenolicum TaxID=296544 RepID=A0ABN5WGJ5_9SPHN|nr:hypothetical protein SBA_ch1_36240 [Sphingomonas bisphenolicum]